MARLEDISNAEVDVILGLEVPDYGMTPFEMGPPLGERRVAIVSTAGLHRRGDRRFTADARDYRVIPVDTPTPDIVMSHLSPNFDRTGFQSDVNVAFPIDRLRELATSGEIGSVADFHYSFMGAVTADLLEERARHLAVHLRNDDVDAVLLVPV